MAYGHWKPIYTNLRSLKSHPVHAEMVSRLQSISCIPAFFTGIKEPRFGIKKRAWKESSGGSMDTLTDSGIHEGDLSPYLDGWAYGTERRRWNAMFPWQRLPSIFNPFSFDKAMVFYVTAPRECKKRPWSDVVRQRWPRQSGMGLWALSQFSWWTASLSLARALIVYSGGSSSTCDEEVPPITNIFSYSMHQSAAGTCG